MSDADAQRDESLLFGGPASRQIAQLLGAAMASYHDAPAAERLLLRAQALDPACLPVYFSLYKFYFYKGRLADAERAARSGLEAAAHQGGFPADWRCLTPACTDWSRPDGPQRFYLFSLKALAFIRLRQGHMADSNEILAALHALDPRDRVGGSVVRGLAARIG